MTGLLGGPIGLAVVTSSGARGPQVVDVLTYTMLATSAVLTHHQWYRSGRTGLAWSTVALVLVACQALTTILCNAFGVDRVGGGRDAAPCGDRDRRARLRPAVTT